MKQKTLEQLEFDEEHPVGTTTPAEWIKLEIGDALIGIFTDRYRDNTYNKMKYIFQPANIIRNQNGKREQYEKVGMNSSGNLDFMLNDDILGEPLKIIRTKDKPIEGKPNPAHQFLVYKSKNNGGEK